MRTANGGDLLTSYNGKPIVYDAIGNPTKIGYYQNLEWNGRQLVKLSAPYETAIQADIDYTYDGDGRRTGMHILHGNEYEETLRYYYNGDILAGQEHNGEKLVFLYDENGEYYGLQYKGSYYYFLKNGQNDIVAIASGETGDLLARYTYDAWGKVLSVTDASGNAITDAEHIANVNPLRYRGYYYEKETGWYWLNTRYYSPAMQRFINADIYASTGNGILDKEIFAYCLNNPINMLDLNGEMPKWLKTVCNGVKKGANYVWNGLKDTWDVTKKVAKTVGTVVGGVEFSAGGRIWVRI